MKGQSNVARLCAQRRSARATSIVIQVKTSLTQLRGSVPSGTRPAVQRVSERGSSDCLSMELQEVLRTCGQFCTRSRLPTWRPGRRSRHAFVQTNGFMFATFF
jgi:hypothetical protein